MRGVGYVWPKTCTILSGDDSESRRKWDSLPPFSLSCYFQLIVNQIILSTYNTKDVEEKPQDCGQPIQPTQVYANRTVHFGADSGSGPLRMSFQHSPYPTPPASWGPSILTRPQASVQTTAGS